MTKEKRPREGGEEAMHGNIDAVNWKTIVISCHQTPRQVNYAPERGKAMQRKTYGTDFKPAVASKVIEQGLIAPKVMKSAGAGEPLTPLNSRDMRAALFCTLNQKPGM